MALSSVQGYRNRQRSPVTLLKCKAYRGGAKRNSNRPLLAKSKRLEPNAQGKLLLEFVPLSQYATISAIEVVAE